MENGDQDPLGAPSSVVDIEKLTRWNSTQLPELVETGSINSEGESEVVSPFPWRGDLNSKIALWTGDITAINTHAIVHSTNEKFSDKTPETERLYERAGPELVADIKKNLRICKTGEAKVSKGFKLLARYVIHTVGPRYNVKYITAAESALFSCYRNVMQQVRENGVRSVAIPCIHSHRRGYPVEDGAHIAIRTVRRFLEKFGEDFDLVVFVCNEGTFDEQNAYNKLLPLYFPRNSKEEAIATCWLPENIGNEDGEPVIAERQIRIMDKPAFASLRNHEDFEQTTDLNREFGTSTIHEVGKHPFAQMEDNPDDVKKSGTYVKNTEEQKRIENQRRYERLLKRAKTEDLTDIAGLKCLYRTGVDRFGRPVVIFVGRNFNANTVNMEKALLYLLRVMEPVVESDFVIVYFHTLTSAANHPPMNYLRQVYSLLDHKYKKNLKAFYIIHPTWWSKLATWFFTTFTASDIKNKVISMNGVQYLYGTIYPDQMDVPAFVTNYDIHVNGPRYYEPPSVENTPDGL